MDRIQMKGRTMLRLPKHPLAMSTGYVALARVLAWEGGASVPLVPLGVRAGHPLVRRRQDHTLNVDHLDRDKLHDELSNYVPSCWPCNRRRRWHPETTEEQRRQAVERGERPGETTDSQPLPRTA